MKVRMKDTVEDAHGIVGEDDLGKTVIHQSIVKLVEGQEYSSDDIPGGERRMAKLVRMGFAEEVRS